MLKQSDKLDQAFPPSFPTNRYAVLEEVQTFLKFNHVRLENLLEVICNTTDCDFTFMLGGVTIHFLHGFKPWSLNRNMVDLCIKFHTDEMGNTETHEYQYSIGELEELRKNMQLKTELERARP